MTSYTTKLTEAQAAALETLVRGGTYDLREIPYARFSGARKDHNLTYYTSGKLVVQGKGTRDFVEFVLEPQILGAAKMGYEAVLDPTLLDHGLASMSPARGISLDLFALRPCM